MKEKMHKNLSSSKWDNSLPKFYFFQLLSIIIFVIIQGTFVYNMRREDELSMNLISSIFMSFGLAIFMLKNRLPNLQFILRSFGKYRFYDPVFYEKKDGSYMNKTEPITNYIIGGLLFLFGFIPSLLVFLMKNKLI